MSRPRLATHLDLDEPGHLFQHHSTGQWFTTTEINLKVMTEDNHSERLVIGVLKNGLHSQPAAYMVDFFLKNFSYVGKAIVQKDKEVEGKSAASAYKANLEKRLINQSAEIDKLKQELLLQTATNNDLSKRLGDAVLERDSVTPASDELSLEIAGLQGKLAAVESELQLTHDKLMVTLVTLEAVQSNLVSTKKLGMTSEELVTESFLEEEELAWLVDLHVCRIEDSVVEIMASVTRLSILTGKEPRPIKDILIKFE